MFVRLASTKMVFLLLLVVCFHSYGKLKISNGKMENRLLLLSCYRDFDKSFTEISSFFGGLIVTETERLKC